MSKPRQISIRVADKQEELVWALDHQGWSHIEIGEMFGLPRMRVWRMVQRRPVDWHPKWVKREIT